MMKRRGILGLIAAGVAAMTTPARAQESTPAADDDRCIGRHTVTGMEFGGTGSQVSDQIEIRDGLLIAHTAMSDSGAIYLTNEAGDGFILGSQLVGAFDKDSVHQVEAGRYYVVSEFYSASGANGNWSLTIEQSTE